MKRLFVGIALGDGAREQAAELSTLLRSSLPAVGANWVSGRNLHLTLQFLGGTDLESTIVEALSRLRAGPFRLGLSGLGSFPDERAARVIWVGASQGRPAIARLAEEVSELMKPLGFKRTEKRYEPHLTLARLKTPSDLRGKLTLEADLQIFDVEEVLVFESKTTPHGAEYQALHAIRLTGEPENS